MNCNKFDVVHAAFRFADKHDWQIGIGKRPSTLMPGSSWLRVWEFNQGNKQPLIAEFREGVSVETVIDSLKKAEAERFCPTCGEPLKPEKKPEPEDMDVYPGEFKLWKLNMCHAVTNNGAEALDWLRSSDVVRNEMRSVRFIGHTFTTIGALRTTMLQQGHYDKAVQ